MPCNEIKRVAELEKQLPHRIPFRGMILWSIKLYLSGVLEGWETHTMFTPNFDITEDKKCLYWGQHSR